jgi:osmotically-inducible protein OsmY
MFRPFIVSSIGVLAVALTAGCAPLAGDAGDRLMEYQLTDQLSSDRSLAYVMAGVRGHTVYLDGWVATHTQRLKAEALAAGMPGITRVFDNIAVGIYERDH